MKTLLILLLFVSSVHGQTTSLSDLSDININELKADTSAMSKVEYESFRDIKRTPIKTIVVRKKINGCNYTIKQIDYDPVHNKYIETYFEYEKRGRELAKIIVGYKVIDGMPDELESGIGKINETITIYTEDTDNLGGGIRKDISEIKIMIAQLKQRINNGR